MKLTIALTLLLMITNTFSVEGYKDIYLDREQTIRAHSIFCGKNFNNLRGLKPTYVYTNTDNIEKGTYYFTSAYGDFSYTFNEVPGKDPKMILARGLLSGGKTQKKDMVQELCIVGKVKGLPKLLLSKIDVITLEVEDPKWDQMMKQLGMFGKPAFAKGLYKDQRTGSKLDAHDQKVFDANQAYLKQLEVYFAKKVLTISKNLPKKLKNAIRYAHQEDGFLQTKKYPVIKKPSVWTATSEKRYEDKVRKQVNEKAWDKVIQENFDWLFKLTGKSNALKSTQIHKIGKVEWNARALQQIVTVSATFENGKSLELDFYVRSSKIKVDLFDTLELIKKKSEASRVTLIASARKVRKTIALPKKRDVKAYDPTSKVNIFFSDFRAKKRGDTYRIK